MTLSRWDKAYFAAFGLLLLTALAWLTLGALPALAAASDGIHALLHNMGRGDGLIARLAHNAAQAAHGAESPAQWAFDYLFSAFNLGLGLLMVWVRPGDRSARLLAMGLVGTSVAFNLQGHDAFQVMPPAALGAVDLWHVLLHVASGLCYVYALLLFPTGRLLSDRGPVAALQILVLGFVTMVTIGLSMFTTDDHTLGLVVVFGVAIPVAGVLAQSCRFWRERDPRRRQQSKVLAAALLLATAVALPLALFTTSTSNDQVVTVTHEISLPEPGVYYFRCDPHPDEMTGTLRVIDGDAPAPAAIELAARDNTFDASEITLAAGRASVVRLTNFDTDLHNIAVYRNADWTDPLFVGPEFSANNSAASAFRIFRLVFAVIPIALFAGLLRFRLWDLDRMITKAIVYGTLIGIVTLAYLAVVVGAGTALGVGSRGNLVLSIVLTAVVAMAFQPLRDRARRTVDRLVYGRRAQPYEVLSEFSRRAGQAFGTHEVLPEMARILADGTSAVRAEVWLKMGSQLLPAAAWPPESERRSATPRSNDEAEIPDADLSVPVVHAGEVLGAIAVFKPAGHAIEEVERKLVDEVASHAGLVLKNVQLAAELQASRHRLVTAQDAERKRLERDIHDGAQQQLVGLAIKLRMARGLADRDPSQAADLLDELQTETTGVLESLRDLARGIHPPVLSDKGVGAALEAHARRCAIEVRVDAHGIGRLASDVEAAVYFCCLEAIQNAAKHSAGPVEVKLVRTDDALSFVVRDPGPGFDPDAAAAGAGIQNMKDRMAALDALLEIRSSPGSETAVVGRVPLRMEVTNS